jgi:hypothetical protein
MTKSTYGECLVRVSFNPSEKAEVKEAKRQCAALIDFCCDQMNADRRLSNEESRLIQQAMDSIEEACMWLVKGLTVPQSES